MDKEVRVNARTAEYSIIISHSIGMQFVEYTKKHCNVNNRVDFRVDVFTDREMEQKVDIFHNHVGSGHISIYDRLSAEDHSLLFTTLFSALGEMEKGNTVNLSFDPETKEIVFRLKETDAPVEDAPVKVTESE